MAEKNNYSSTSSPSELEKLLVSKAQKGDRESMAHLLLPYEQPLFRFLTAKLRHEDNARDVTQEVLVKLMRSLNKYQERGTFKAWVFQIARNEAINFMKKHSRLSTATISSGGHNLFDNQLDEGPSVVECLDQKERNQGIRECVSNLPDAERDVVNLRMDEDVTFREIAEMTNTSLNTVLGRMRNASRRLKNCLLAKGIVGQSPMENSTENPE